MNDESFFNINPYRKEINPGISLFTAIKNRTDLLEKALPTWTICNEIDEIIIVDWSSDKSLRRLIRKFQNGKILLVMVTGQGKWILSRAFNLAARFTTGRMILKIDADVMIRPGFFDKHTLKPGLFFSGNWAMGRDDNERHLNGNAFLYRDDFFKVNGYNEYIKSYGWDDDDLFLRLESLGLKRKYFDIGTLKHLEHTGRMKLQDSPDYLKTANDTEKSNLQIILNRYITQHFLKWQPENRMLEFTVELIDKHTVSCKQATEDLNIFPEEFFGKSEIPAILERLGQSGVILTGEIARNMEREEVIAFYDLFISADASPDKHRLFGFIRKLNELHLEEASRLDAEIKRLDRLINEKEQAAQAKEDAIRKTVSKIKDCEQRIQDLTTGLEEKDRQLLTRDRLIGEKDISIHEGLQLVKDKESLIRQKEEQILARDRRIEVEERRLREMDETIREQKSLILEKEAEIGQKKETIMERDNTIQEHLGSLTGARSLISEKERIIDERNDQILDRESSILEKEKLIRQKEQIIEEKDQKIIEMENLLTDTRTRLSDVYRSYSWRFGHAVFAVIGKLVFWIKNFRYYSRPQNGDRR